MHDVAIAHDESTINLPRGLWNDMSLVADSSASLARTGSAGDPLALLLLARAETPYSAHDLALVAWAAELGTREGRECRK